MWILFTTLFSGFPKRNSPWFKEKEISDHRQRRCYLSPKRELFFSSHEANNTLHQGALTAGKPEAHSNPRGQPSCTAGYLWTVQDMLQASLSTELSPLACPGHRGASRGVPRLASPSFSFALIVLNTTYWASTLCLFLHYVPLPPQILQRVWLNKVKLREHYQSGMVVFVFVLPNKKPKSKWLKQKEVLAYITKNMSSTTSFRRSRIHVPTQTTGSIFVSRVYIPSRKW